MNVDRTRVLARGTVIGRETGGRRVAPGPRDHVTWGERLARFAERDDLASGERLVLVSGRVSPHARNEHSRSFEARHPDPVQA